MGEVSDASVPVAHEIVKEYYVPHALQSRHLRIFFLQRIYGVFLHNAKEKESITASPEIQQEEKRE